MGELLLTLLGNSLTVDLVALAVIVVGSSQQATTTISTRAIRVPDSMNGHESVVGLRVSCTVNEDGTAILRLARNVLGKTDMAVLLIAKRNSLASSSGQSRAGRVRFEVALGLGAHVVGREYLGAARRNKVDHLRLIETGTTR